MTLVSPATRPGVKPLRPVTEAVRERETFKYEPLLAHDFRFYDSAEIATADNSILTALAQLSVLQTGCERAVISLVDSTHQYVLAEACASTPLTPRLHSDKCPQPLVACRTAVPRNKGVCEHVLSAPGEHTGLVSELPLLLVRNLADDARFASSPCCLSGENEQFCAAVPIRTERGINIGFLCVYNSKVMDSWDRMSTQYLRDISATVMVHLEANRSRHAYRRNERMNRGMGSFIEGKSTLSGWKHGPNVNAFENFAKLEGALDERQQQLDNQEPGRRQSSVATPPEKGILSELPPESMLPPDNANGHGKKSPFAISQAFDEMTAAKGENTNSTATRTVEIFSRAANLIRESFEIAGCLFFDVTLGSYKTPTVQSPIEETNGDSMSPRWASSTSSSDEQLSGLRPESADDPCELLGFSTSDVSSINERELARGEAIVSKRTLAKLLRRYPTGKIFNFDAAGELQSSDSSEDDGVSVYSSDGISSNHDYLGGSVSTPAQRKQARKQVTRVNDGEMIRMVFPGARSVAFIPVWDSKRERWFAGGFIYTLTPTRVFTIFGELSFLKAFTQLIVAEVHNLETIESEQAKSDALGSLSHELRSPLHGIILSTELLNDTELSVFQGNAAHTIETCCRTLLDAIDHLLDYSKVNSFAVKRKQEARTKSSSMSKRTLNGDLRNDALLTHANLSGLVEEVAESVFAGYNFQHKSVRQLANEERVVSPDSDAHNRLDFAQAMEQLGPIGESNKETLQFANVSVLVRIDPAYNWMFKLQAGAVRRIIMNLLGNALKYTAKGAIQISLSQEPSSRRIRSERMVKITVEDTGKGIGEHYLRHQLFHPFCQKDALSPGTGLGLSLVKKIVSQMRGHITVESEVGVGTVVRVMLPLDQSPKSAEISQEDKEYGEHRQELKGMRVQLRGFESWGSGLGKGCNVIEDICRRFLHLEILDEEESANMAPDLIMWSDEALSASLRLDASPQKTPQVVVCRDVLVAYKLFSDYEVESQRGIFEFLPQPVGPRKLARVIALAYRRWVGLPKMMLPLRIGKTAIPATESALRPKLARASSAYASSTPGIAAIDPDLRISPARPNDTAAKGSPLAAPGTPVSEPVPGEHVGPKILVVDDNYINRKILSAYLGKLHQSYETANNGKEAVDAFTSNPSQVAGILMDISMPIMDGFEATRKIRAYESKNQLQPVPILALTGLASDNAYREAQESGVDIFLTKPVRLNTLVEAMERVSILAK